MLETGQCHLYSKGSTVLLSCQLPTDFHNISICHRCLNGWCRFASDDLWNAVVCFQPPSLLIGKVWLPVVQFCVSLILCKVHWRMGRRLHIDFCTTIDRVNHQVILYQICSGGIGGSVFSTLTQFISNRSQNVMVDGCWSKLVNVMSGVP